MKWNIKVNGRDVELLSDRPLTYEDALLIAKERDGATAVYHYGDGRAGTLYRGSKPAELEQGLRLEVMMTGDA